MAEVTPSLSDLIQRVRQIQRKTGRSLEDTLALEQLSEQLADAAERMQKEIKTLTRAHAGAMRQLGVRVDRVAELEGQIAKMVARDNGIAYCQRFTPSDDYYFKAGRQSVLRELSAIANESKGAAPSRPDTET